MQDLSPKHRLIAEWEPQAAVMLTWPHSGTDWAQQLDAVERVYQRLVQLITRDQNVLIVCRDEAHQAAIRTQLAKSMTTDPAGTDAQSETRLDPVQFALAPSNDSWARDHGPISVIDRASGQHRLIDFRFNGWGGKYPAEFDDRITATLYAAGSFARLSENPLDSTAKRPCAGLMSSSSAAADACVQGAEEGIESSQLVLEGGAIETDGAGSLLAVRRTIVDPKRNPGWSQAAIETELRNRLGLERFLWLEHGQLSGDDTDGHIDTLARFCDPQTICYAASDDPSDPDHPALERLAAELRALRQRNGEPYRLVALPQPAPIHDEDGQRLPAGYANFLIINRAVLVPVYDDPADLTACERLAGCFPGHRIEPVDCRPLIRQGGSLHCITMQLPA
ncbi:agmatine deiminase family protein [Lamprobacter modestohalophilus]|uniref:agmatine deiminase family protein n=1 Tax=Lamprobacter modestohalophilus TaxID=1064514 RepID=UPI002ADEDDD7|nr:agmatine deiminase family protein [Lamprobacter modestohalophilus]MEA1048646.1 agmatine deiminase family protein [Lamprobacter modestohalophilus]